MDRPVRVSLDFPRSGQRVDVYVTIPVKLSPELTVREGKSRTEVPSYSATYSRTTSPETFATAA